MDSNSNSCQGFTPARDNIYDMNVQQLIDTFTAGTTIMLERNSSDPISYLESVQYMPMKCLLEDNKPHLESDVSRVKTIGLWATLFASISWIYKKMSGENPNMDYLRAALRRITYVCALELDKNFLSPTDLHAISITPKFRELLVIIRNPKFSELFDGRELETVRRCFLKLGIDIITAGVGSMSLGSSSSYASSASSAAASPFVPGSWFGHSVAQNNKIQQQQQYIQHQQQQLEHLQSQWQPEQAQASTSTDVIQRVPFGQPTPFTSAFGTPPSLSYQSHTLDRQQQQPQDFGVRAPVTMSLEDALSLLEYSSVDEIGNQFKLTAKVVSLKKSDPANGQKYVDAGNIIRNYLKKAGKRRTMKVKKHFRKTKKRFVKRVKKTRVQRNNKSKRVFKGKKG
jgi:hypothetical protein